MRTLTITLLFLTACRFGDVAPPTIVCSEQHSWEDYHLPHDSLSPVVLNESGYTPDLVGWNQLGTPIELRTSGDGFAITVQEGGDEGSGWLGLATVKVGAGGHIRQATVTMNRTLLAAYDPRVADHVLCQELGHLLGLGHQRQADDSCLDDCQGRGSGWLACLSSAEGTTPNAHDAEQLETIYAHAGDGKPPTSGCVGSLVLHAFPVEGARGH